MLANNVSKNRTKCPLSLLARHKFVPTPTVLVAQVCSYGFSFSVASHTTCSAPLPITLFARAIAGVPARAPHCTFIYL
jgi:hypothetical protein